MQIYVLHDKKAKIYGVPLATRNEVEMVRNITTVVNIHDDSMLYRYPDDFDLYLLGTYDDNTGTITLLSEKEFILNCLSVKGEDVENA